ncbi:hypothetical protein HZH68_009569 [Vespula germanica]|uniref:Uncharacterized protein n=1 Tax=Vespula germanica TaxID=30212 RepID=A0A834JYX3_VESGE|nr:hypothetical protein HZH68_009569 [Vespula germanica]
MKSCILFFLLFMISLAVSQVRLNKKYKTLLQKLNEPSLEDQIMSKKEEINSKNRRTDEINKGFEKVIDFVNVLGQINDFVSDRTKNIIRKLNNLYNSDENEY